MTANPDKTPVSHEEFKELESIIAAGKSNFSKEQLQDAYFKHPLDLSTKSAKSYFASANYVFRCSCCTDIGFSAQWYKIIVDTIGGSILDQQKSSVSALQRGFDGNNIAKILPEDNAEYFYSTLNHAPGEGFVCDHCRVSCYDDNMALLGSESSKPPTEFVAE